MLWVRDFGDHTISGRGFNLFKPLRRHFRADSGRRDKWSERGSPVARVFPRFPSSRGSAQRQISPLVHRRRIRPSPTQVVGAASPGAEAGCRSGLAGTLGHGGFLEWRRAFEQHTTILLLRKQKLENLEGSHLAKTRSYRERGVKYPSKKRISPSPICMIIRGYHIRFT